MLLSPIPSFVLCTVRWLLLEMRNYGECQQLKGPYPAKPLKHMLLPSRSLHTLQVLRISSSAALNRGQGANILNTERGSPGAVSLCALCRGTVLTADLCTTPTDHAVPSAALLHGAVLGHRPAAPGAEQQDIYLFKKVSCLSAYFANLSSVFT